MESTRPAPLQRLSIALLYAAVVAFALTAGALQFTRTDLDPMAMPLSTYLRGPGGACLRGAYDLMAASLAVFAFAGYRATLRAQRSALASMLFMVAALALPVVAHTVLFENTAQENLARLLHGLAAQATFLCLVMGMLLWSSRWQREEGVRKRRAGVVLAWLAFVQMWMLALWKGLPPGLMQKLLIVLILLWLGWAAS
ncbi:DUF998 domain-containing protein [Dyella jiangningensis]|uniref:DUF998 domain-containing protein n=1 Tax=Dyella jiangningensis TaxID=1379159 RepID=A0A328PDD7_9GAMM|nr:DUF998 domain-containing protein [Dyella jiangningensis]RAO77864.1 hypothetical protein CA260_08465 [Dyella jiangningensis]